jgi:hypothetical protein
MFSIRKSLGLLAIAAIGSVGGCQAQLGPKPPWNGGLSDAAIPTDHAMQLRQWDTSSTFYVNDAVLAHPFYSPLQSEQIRYRLGALSEPVFFLADAFYLPVGVFLEYPWEMQVNKAIAAPPSYTLMPALPNGPEPVPTY